MMLHAIYETSSPEDLGQEDFKLFPKRQSLDPSKLREFADDNFKFVENGGKFFERTKNTAEKGGITRYEQFLLFPKCFQKTCTADT